MRYGVIKIFTASSTTLYRKWSAFSLSSAIIKSRKLFAVCSNVLSGFKNEIAGGTSPRNTAVACLPSLCKKIVNASAADSSSTDGLALTVTKILVTSLMLSIILCFEDPSAIFFPIFCFYLITTCLHYTISITIKSIVLPPLYNFGYFLYNSSWLAIKN